MDYAVALDQIDQRSVLFLNSFLGEDILWNKIIKALGNAPLTAGFPVFFSLAAVWFFTNDQQRRARISAGLFATYLAVGLSVFLQFHVYIHTRPFLDKALHLKLVDPKMVLDWDRLSSFPSDTATLFFSICTVVFMEFSLPGSIAFLWSLVTVGILRVLMGYHYPSDILGGFALGTGVVLLIAKNRYIVMVFDRLLDKVRSTEYILHGLFCIVFAEAYDGFPSQAIAKGLWTIIKYLIGLT